MNIYIPFLLLHVISSTSGTMRGQSLSSRLKNEGNASFKNKEYEIARTKYIEAIKFCPDEDKETCSKLHSNLANVEYQVGHFEASAMAAMKALELDESNAKANHWIKMIETKIQESPLHMALNASLSRNGAIKLFPYVHDSQLKELIFQTFRKQNPDTIFFHEDTSHAVTKDAHVMLNENIHNLYTRLRQIYIYPAEKFEDMVDRFLEVVTIIKTMRKLKIVEVFIESGLVDVDISALRRQEETKWKLKFGSVSHVKKQIFGILNHEIFDEMKQNMTVQDRDFDNYIIENQIHDIDASRLTQDQYDSLLLGGTRDVMFAKKILNHEGSRKVAFFGRRHIIGVLKELQKQLFEEDFEKVEVYLPELGGKEVCFGQEALDYAIDYFAKVPIEVSTKTS